jgi:hypothetical protein
MVVTLSGQRPSAGSCGSSIAAHASGTSKSSAGAAPSFAPLPLFTAAFRPAVDLVVPLLVAVELPQEGALHAVEAFNIALVFVFAILLA